MPLKTSIKYHEYTAIFSKIRKHVMIEDETVSEPEYLYEC